LIEDFKNLTKPSFTIFMLSIKALNIDIYVLIYVVLSLICPYLFCFVFEMSLSIEAFVLFQWRGLDTSIFFSIFLVPTFLRVFFLKIIEKNNNR